MSTDYEKVKAEIVSQIYKDTAFAMTIMKWRQFHFEVEQIKRGVV